MLLLLLSASFFLFSLSLKFILHNRTIWFGCRYIFTTIGETLKTLKIKCENLIELNFLFFFTSVGFSVVVVVVVVITSDQGFSTFLDFHNAHIKSTKPNRWNPVTVLKRYICFNGLQKQWCEQRLRKHKTLFFLLLRCGTNTASKMQEKKREKNNTTDVVDYMFAPL